MSKNLQRNLAVVGMVVIAFFAGRSGVVSQQTVNGKAGSGECCEGIDMSHFEEVWSVIQDSFVGHDNIDEDQAIDGALKGFVTSLGDPHSEYYSEEESEVFLSSLDSELEGIGAELTDENGYLEVVTPIKGSPAENAGLKTGDVIVSVDGNDIRGEDLFEIIDKIRGKKGTKVTLGILENAEDTYSDKRDVVIVRDTIEVPSVYTETLADDELEYFYVSVNQFSNDTEQEFMEAVNEILVQQPDGLILDLRFNGGGYLTTSVGMLGELLPTGSKVVNIQQSSEKLESEIFADGRARLTDIPLVVLVNQASASASEIVAGAVQDNDRGVVMGTQTYGKGTVQELIPFSDGSTLRLTVSKWLTPLGTDIDHAGITPDILIDFTEEELEGEVDVQLERAKEYLRSKLAI